MRGGSAPSSFVFGSCGYWTDPAPPTEPWSTSLNAVRVRPRWAALPLATALSLPLLTALPAHAAASAEYRGYLSDSSTGTRYIAVDASDNAVFTSQIGAVDGALGAVTDAGPTVVYISKEPSGSSYVEHLHVAAPGGTDRVVYAAPTGVALSEPALSNDGADLLVVSDSATTSAILAVDVASAAVRTVRSSTSTDYYGPSFSPDASFLSWTQENAAGSDVAVARFATGTASVLAHSSGPIRYEDSAWSPDGTQLAVTAAQDGPGTGLPVDSLYLIDPRSGSYRVVVRGFGSSSSATSYVEPTWAADSSQLYATRLVITSTGDVSGELVRLTFDGNVWPVTAPAYAGAPSVAGPFATDGVAPALSMTTTTGAAAHLVFSSSDTDVAELIVTRSTGEPSDTPTADIEVGRTRGLTFDVPLPTPGTTYGISVFARDWSGNLSPAVKATVTSAGASALTVSTPAPRAAWRTGVKLTGVLSASSGPLVGEKVMLYARRAMTSTPLAVATATTDASGGYTVGYVPQWTAEYQVRYLGSTAGYAVASAKRTVTVIPAMSFGASAATVRLGRSVTLSGSVGPNHAGQVVTIQRKVNGVWRSIASTRLSSTSTYRLSFTPNARGTWELRAYKGADGDHAATSSSGRTISVS